MCYRRSAQVRSERAGRSYQLIAPAYPGWARLPHTWEAHGPGRLEGVVLTISKSQVNKAGKTLQAWKRGDLVSNSEYEAALSMILAFRAMHSTPLTKATMGLRSSVKTEGCRIEVSQRLKRVPTILDKLVREPTLALANMQDIGGCRAVLENIGEVRRVQKRVMKAAEKRIARGGQNGVPVRVSDYIAAPRASGYRAVHVIVQYDGRNIEVQLRTQYMHEWAYTVERLSGRLRADLKGGQGPKEVLDLMEAISEAMALEEAGETVDTATVERIGRLRQAAVPYLGETS